MDSGDDSDASDSVTTMQGKVVIYFIFYIGEGFLLTVLCFLITILIATKFQLNTQKEYILLAGTMGFGAFFSLGYVIVGIWRINIFYANIFTQHINGWDCFKTIHNLIFVYTTMTSGILTLAVSLERLFLLVLPLRYYVLMPRHIYAYLTITLLSPIPIYVMAGVHSYTQLNGYPNAPITCSLNDSVIPQDFTLLRGIRVVCTVLSAILYFPIGYKIYLMIHKPSTITQINKDIQYKRVIRTTLTITLITFNQIICFTLPDIAILFFDLPYNIGFYVMNLNNAALNVLIFFTTQYKHVRLRLWKNQPILQNRVFIAQKIVVQN